LTINVKQLGDKLNKEMRRELKVLIYQPLEDE